MKQVLLYINKENTNLDTLYLFLEKEEILYTVIDDSNMNYIIKDLFTTEKKKGNTSEKFSFSFILFSDFEKDDIMNFLQNAKQEGIQFSHKAMLTENNQDWKLEDLLLEIKEEHQFFQAWEKLHVLLKEANDVNPKDYTEESYEPYKESFLQAYVFTKSPKKEMINEILKKLENAKSKLKARTK